MAVRVTADQARELAAMVEGHPRGVRQLDLAPGSMSTLHVARHHKNWTVDEPSRTEVLMAGDGRVVHSSYDEKEAR